MAAVDAVRHEDEPGPAAETSAALERGRLPGQLRDLGARGQLTLFDDGCGGRTVALPSLDEQEDPPICRPAGAISPDGRLEARCLGDAVEVLVAGSRLPVRVVPGCAPAWRPDGALTVAQGRQVVCRGGTRCEGTLIGRAELHRAARLHPTVPEHPTRLRVLVDGVAWLSPSRAAVLLSIRAGGRLAGLGALSEIAFFERGRVALAQPYVRMTGGRLAASPRGTYVTQTPDVILRADGSRVSLPAHLRDVRWFAWSPDERFLALATTSAVHVLDVDGLERYDETGSGLHSVTLPFAAVELAWR